MQSCHERKISVIWLLQVTKFSVKKVNRGAIIDLPWWCKTWQPSGYSPTHAKQNLPGDPEEPNEVLGAKLGAQSDLHWQFLGIWQVLRGSFLESLYVYTTQIRNKLDCWKGSSQSKRGEICGATAVRSGWRMVGGFHGMLLLLVKHSG